MAISDVLSEAIEEINGSVRHSTELISEGHETSRLITQLIEQTRKIFASLTAAIKEITGDSRKLGEAVATVNDVAFHTNLLSLNASVEAARAGEHELESASAPQGAIGEDGTEARHDRPGVGRRKLVHGKPMGGDAALGEALANEGEVLA